MHAVLPGCAGGGIRTRLRGATPAAARVVVPPCGAAVGGVAAMADDHRRRPAAGGRAAAVDTAAAGRTTWPARHRADGDIAAVAVRLCPRLTNPRSVPALHGQQCRQHRRPDRGPADRRSASHVAATNARMERERDRAAGAAGRCRPPPERRIRERRRAATRARRPARRVPRIVHSRVLARMAPVATDVADPGLALVVDAPQFRERAEPAVVDRGPPDHPVVGVADVPRRAGADAAGARALA